MKQFRCHYRRARNHIMYFVYGDVREYSCSRSRRPAEARSTIRSTGLPQSCARQRLDPCRKTSQLAGDRVGVNHAFPGCPLHLRLRGTKGFSRRRFVAAGDRSLNLLDESPHAGFARIVSRGTSNCLSNALTRRGGIGHFSYESHHHWAAQHRVAALQLGGGRQAFYACEWGVSRQRRTTTGCEKGPDHSQAASQHGNTASFHFLFRLNMNCDQEMPHLRPQCVLDTVTDRVRRCHSHCP